MTALMRAVFALALVVFISPVHAQNADFPNRPIKLLVGFAAGGGTDVAARVIAQKMSEILGQGVVVENRTGASGLIAACEGRLRGPFRPGHSRCRRITLPFSGG